MKYQSTSNFAFHILSKKQLNFYHVHLSKTTAEEVLENLSYGSNIKLEPDGSMTVTINQEGYLQQTITELKLFFLDIENNLIETPNAYYHLTESDEDDLKEWSVSILGSIALILLHDSKLKDVLSGKWEFIAGRNDRVYVEPFTLVFAEKYVKIVHPLREQNYEQRKYAEYVASSAYSKIYTRIKEAYPGCEGLALISYAQEQTGLSIQEMSSLIQKKSLLVL